VILLKLKIIQLLEKYEDGIMENTLGDSIDDGDDRYVEVYKYEWGNHKEGIAHTLEQLRGYGASVSPTGLAFIIITEWSGVMTFSDGDLNIEGLEKVCKKILKELN